MSTPVHPDDTALPARLRGLLRPEHLPHPAAVVEVVETQLSWVLLAGEHAYKIKRPVRFEFVDFSSLERRHHFCLEELRLNQRFAPQLYLEVCAITGEGERACIGGPGVATEYAVVLRRFDRNEELDRLVREDRVSGVELAAFGQRLAGLHAALPRLAADVAAGPEAILAAVARNAAECAAAAAVFGGAQQVSVLGAAVARECELRRSTLARRAAGGRVRECHGDLHLSNVVRLQGELTPFDCLEFQPAFRHIDVAQDLAFLVADLHGYGRPRLAGALLNGWLAASGDYEACRVLRLYEADRALVRAKVLALAAGASPPPPPPAAGLLATRHAAYLAVAERALQPAPPLCVLMHGLPGSGKSWLAARLADELGAVHVQSDAERKRLAGLQPFEASHSSLDRGLYTAEQTDRIYARLGQCAADVLEGQRTVIVDANFGLRRQRAGLAAQCAAQGVPLAVVSCEAPLAVLRERIRLRQGQGTESEADLAVLERQLQRREAIEAGESLAVIVADTTRPDVVERVGAQLRQRANL